MSTLKKLLAFGALAAANLAGSPLSAADRIRVVANANYAFTSLAFSDTRTFTEYAETARVESRYTVDGGLGFDGAVQVDLYKGFGLLVGYSASTRSVTGTLDASLPHPLFLNRPRTLSGEFSGYDYKEGALHLDVAFGRRQGAHLDWALFAGVTLFQLEVDLLDRVVYNQAYPYDEVTLGQAPATTVKESPSGFNVGGRLDYRFGSSGRFGLGVQVRYSGANVKVRAGQDATEISFDAGGFQAGAGVRLYF